MKFVTLLLSMVALAVQVGEPGGATGEGQAKPFGGRGVLLLEVADTINPGVAKYISEGIREASDRGMAAVVIRLDTPGGLLEATRTIVQEILDSPLPVVVYVAPGGARAGSAGTFITMAAHVAAMAPGSNIGAAHPVGTGGEDPEKGGKHIAQKVENDAAAFIESIAERRGRNKEWARKAVTESLSVPTSKALDLGVIDISASTLHDLLEWWRREISGKAGGEGPRQ